MTSLSFPIFGRRGRHAIGLLAALAVGLYAAPSFAQGEGQPALLQQFGDWGVYAGLTSGKKVCFALAQPASAQTNPPNRPRDPVYLFVSTRPAENVRNEISVIIGYPHKPGTEATADVGTAHFSLQTQSDNAWLKNAGEEERLLDAMRKGSDLVVKGVSGRGTQTTDRYSLRGLGQALDRVGQECR
jgi:invasion protein IalB